MRTSTSQFAFIIVPMNRTPVLYNLSHVGVIMLCGSEVYPNETPRNEICRNAVPSVPTAPQAELHEFYTQGSGTVVRQTTHDDKFFSMSLCLIIGCKIIFYVCADMGIWDGVQ